MSQQDPRFPAIVSGATSRREFLKRGTALSMVAAGATPLALNLAAIGEASAATASDYKAIVCVYLNGGNDHANTLVPYDTANWQTYNSLRGNIGYAHAQLGATALAPTTALPGGVQYALAPELAALHPLFAQDAVLAPVLNVGTLIEPTTRDQYLRRSVRLPPKIGSHNDQTSFWQSSLAEGATTGWGGRMGDLFADSNGRSTFACVGVGGNSVFLSGHQTSQYQITPTGAIQIRALRASDHFMTGYSRACAQALEQVLTKPYGHMFEDEYARLYKRSIDSEAAVASAVGNVTLKTPFPTKPGATDGSLMPLAAQLQMVARMIAARGTLGVKRQVFMVSLGGFDNHANLRKDHAPLLEQVGQSMAAFYRATQELGIADKVTTFTASEFGRTLTSNSSGSDHGWGSMHFVLGGAVRGKNYVGTSPVLASNGPDDIGQGRLVPTTSVDQLATTLATWFGVSPAEQEYVMPNIRNFSTRDLSFLKPT